MNWIYLSSLRNILNFWLWVILIHSRTNHSQYILKSRCDRGKVLIPLCWFAMKQWRRMFSEFFTLKSIFTFKTPWFRFAGLRWGNGEECLSFFAEFSIFPRISQTSSHVAGKLQNSEQKMHWSLDSSYFLRLETDLIQLVPKFMLFCINCFLGDEKKIDMMLYRTIAFLH